MWSFECIILIKNLWKCKRFSARSLIYNFPAKSGKDHFLQKLRTTTWIERITGSDRPLVISNCRLPQSQFRDVQYHALVMRCTSHLVSNMLCNIHSFSLMQKIVRIAQETPEF